MKIFVLLLLVVVVILIIVNVNSGNDNSPNMSDSRQRKLNAEMSGYTPSGIPRVYGCNSADCLTGESINGDGGGVIDWIGQNSGITK